MVTIQTRQNKKSSWWCSATVDSYDHSFEGETLSLAQAQMKDFLDKKNIAANERKWEVPELYPEQEQKQKRNPEDFYRSWRIDTDMV